jgi:fructosamine-3-kinase
MLPEILKNNIVFALNNYSGSVNIIDSIHHVGGGSINNTLQIKTNSGNYFIKWNFAEMFPEMFKKEVAGLRILKETSEIMVPGVVLQNDFEKYSYLILKFIESARPQKDFWINFGYSMAKLHRHTNSYFGLDHNNYIGSLPQNNRLHGDWVSFFIEERLEFQIKLARDNQLIDSSIVRHFEKLFMVISEIFPVEKPSLLHGDLWSGNFMVAENGSVCIMDPAVYYGFREMDIAMSKLFGGFSTEFYSAYHEEFPMEKGWHDRVDICNLYPLMVHVNLFGGGYISSVRSIINKF